MDTLVTLLGMIGDLLNGYDPALPSDHLELAPVARILARIYDLWLTLSGS